MLHRTLIKLTNLNGLFLYEIMTDDRLVMAQKAVNKALGLLWFISTKTKGILIDCHFTVFTGLYVVGDVTKTWKVDWLVEIIEI